MKINSLTITNFRCYYEENKIDFNTDGKITLIYGDSGYGKSSLLQFFRWMFYNDPDFGKDNEKPLFNNTAYAEKNINDHIEVKGIINFEHMNTKYTLEKSHIYTIAQHPNNAKLERTDYILQYLDANNWIKYPGDISKKINSIMPKGLSKYFLLEGEKAREIVLNPIELKIAINALFGIDAYEKAIDHIGTTSSPKTVANYYSKIMTSQIKTTSGMNISMSPTQFQEELESLNDRIESRSKLRRDLNNNIRLAQNRRDEILKILGEASNKKNIQEIIKRDEVDIKKNEEIIENTKVKIGNLFYKCYPYLLMAKTTNRSAAILREKLESFSVDYHNIFNNLKKNLLIEIKEKGVCVCGRELDENSIKYIDETMSIMPPDSYTFQFGQFINKSKGLIQAANLNIFGYDNIISEIALLQKQIADLEADKKDKENDLKKLNDAQELVDELDKIDKDMIEYNRNLKGFNEEIAKMKQIFEISERQLKKIIENSKVSSKYSKIISFFKEIHDELAKEKIAREKDISNSLNECVKDVFKKLTTQTELDVDKIQFVNSNFSLRTTYLSGGQLAIDEYSYVIGIIKALQKFGLDNNENPIIIDAPFAFTGNEQSEHIFKTLPSVVKQTILLTLDLNKIKNVLLKDKNAYELYIIKNETQEKAIIERGDINEIKF